MALHQLQTAVLAGSKVKMSERQNNFIRLHEENDLFETDIGFTDVELRVLET